jgi:outer membrane receptor protein involved in Fe transport
MKANRYRTLNGLAFLVLACLALPWQGQLFAQEARGTIVGVVTDVTGAAIPGATVTVTNVAMGTTLTLQTNAVGVYQVPLLIPGEYQVSAESEGFMRAVRSGVMVRVSDRLELDMKLELGAVEQSITVTGDTPLLETTTASAGRVVDSRRIAELPIAHGTPYALIGLAGGVAFTGNKTLDRPFEPTHIVGYAISGVRGNRSDVMIDGIPSTSTANANEVIASYVPPADAVREFKVETATFDASFGQTEGGVTNISLKSGTNQLHGAVSYFKMAPSLFANSWFANRNSQEKTDFTYDRWGATVGGPVVLPKLYDGRNKTFFLWGYEAIDESRPRNNGTRTVPTEAMKGGDFSQLLALGNQYQIYDPASRRAVEGGRFAQDPFVGNIVPQSRFSPVATNLLEYWPKPLTAGQPDGTLNMEEPNLPEVIDYFTHTVRMDHSLTDNQRLSGRFSYYDRDSNYNNYFHSLATGQWFQFLSRAGSIDHVFVVSPTTVINTRYGFNRFVRVTAVNPEAEGFDLTSLGFPKSYNDAISADVRSFPGISMTGYQNTNAGGEWRPTETHAFNMTVLNTVNTHSLKSGVDFRVYRENDIFSGNDQTGRFNFDAKWTRGPFDNSPTAPGSLGQSVAAFLLGLPTSATVARSPAYSEQSTALGLFVQDDWRVNDKLTINVGLRYEYEAPLTERFDRSVRQLDLNAIQPIEEQVRANYAQNPVTPIPADQFDVRGGLTFVNVGGNPRGAFDTPKMNFAPRFGVAYQLTEQTVLRAGYGIFYGFLGQRRRDVIQTGFSATTQMVPTLDEGLNFIATLDNPFPNGIVEPVGAAEGTQTFLGKDFDFFIPNPSTVYNQRWQFGIQHDLGGGYVLETSYVGNRGTHLQTDRRYEATPLEYLSTSAVRDQGTIDFLTANVANPFYPLLPDTQLAGSKISRDRLLRTFPQFGNVRAMTDEGYSWYHALQAGVEKRFAQGFTLMGNYTLSKFMEAREFLNYADPRPVEVISDQDSPHRLSVSGIFELPFGRGKPLLANTSSAVSKIVGGWQLQGVYVFQSGFPINFGTDDGYQRNGNILMYGDMRDAVLPTDEQTVERWFNVDAGFEKNTKAQLDRNLRSFPLRWSFLRGHAWSNYDLSVIKNTEIREGKQLQFRAEFLNAFNHPNFAAPTGNALNPTNATFGQVTSTANVARRIQLGLKFLF